MKEYRIVTSLNELSIVVDEDYKMAVFTNNKYYDPFTFKSLEEDGRMLREANRRTCNDLVAKAVPMVEELKKRDRKKLDDYAESKAMLPRTSFADALQDAFLATLTEKASDELIKSVYPKVEGMIVEKFGVVPIEHIIKLPERKPFETTEVLHKDFDRILHMLLDGEAVYLCGAAGTGKSYLAQQLETALELEYYYTNSVTDDVQIKGFVDANGRYHETQFYKAFTQGGVFLLDELDASIPETLVMLNNALANGYFAFPNGKAQAHKDFHCIAAGNTFGTGADSKYVGRYQLDASSMDRFALVMVDYDMNIERVLANGDQYLLEFAHSFRNALNEVGINGLCTYRSIKRLSKFSGYMTKVDALRIGLIKGMADDDVTLLSKKMKLSNNNPWMDALRKYISGEKDAEPTPVTSSIRFSFKIPESPEFPWEV